MWMVDFQHLTVMKMPRPPWRTTHTLTMFPPLLLWNECNSSKQVCVCVCVRCTCSTATQIWSSLCVPASVWAIETERGFLFFLLPLLRFLLLSSATFTTIHALIRSHALIGCHTLVRPPPPPHSYWIQTCHPNIAHTSHRQGEQPNKAITSLLTKKPQPP